MYKYIYRMTARNLEEAKNAEVARVISAFLKKLLMQIKSKLNSKLSYVVRMGIIQFELMLQVEKLIGL